MSMFMRGVPLSRVWIKTEDLLDVLRRHRLREPLGIVTAIRQAIRNLQGRTAGPDSFSDDLFDESAFVRELAAYGSRHLAHMYFIVKMQVLYLHGAWQAAIETGLRSAAYLKDSPGMLHVADHYFYQALAHAAIGQPSRILPRAAARFRKWARQCPDNFLHKSQVLEAERLRVAGRVDDALAMYRRAAETAATYGYLHIEALAADLERRTLTAAGRSADDARTRAMAAYARWDASALAAEQT
jgi:hypothetical protein